MTQPFIKIDNYECTRICIHCRRLTGSSNWQAVLNNVVTPGIASQIWCVLFALAFKLFRARNGASSSCVVIWQRHQCCMLNETVINWRYEPSQTKHCTASRASSGKNVNRRQLSCAYSQEGVHCFCRFSLTQEKVAKKVLLNQKRSASSGLQCSQTKVERHESAVPFRSQEAPWRLQPDCLPR